MMRIRYLVLISAVVAMAAASIAMPRAANAGGGCHIRGTSDSTSTTVAMRGNCFASTVTRVDEGATVTWLNEDDVAHNVTGAGYTWGGQEAVLKGESVQQTFDENGVYVYSCLLHPGMVGAIVVGDGSGDGGEMATLASEGRSAAGVGNPGSAPQGQSQAASSGDEGRVSALMIAAAVAGGVVLLVAFAAGGFALARSAASRATAR